MITPKGEAMRMDAYYYSFDSTGVEAIDKILSAVACAGKAYHHTESWNDTNAGAWPPHTGNSPADWFRTQRTRLLRHSPHAPEAGQ